MFRLDTGEARPRVPPRVIPIFPHRIWLSAAEDVAIVDKREAYSPVVPTEIIERALAKWDTSTAVPWLLSEYL